MRQPHKMVKHTETIHLSMFHHFAGLALKGLIKWNPKNKDFLKIQKTS